MEKNYLTKEERQRFEEMKKKLSERKASLPGILKDLQGHMVLLDTVRSLNEKYTSMISLADTQYFLDLNFPELTGRMMIDGLYSFNRSAKRKRMLKVIGCRHPLKAMRTDEAIKCLRLQEERLKELKQWADNEKEDDIVHPYYSIVKNLQRIDPECTGPLAELMLDVAEKAEEETKRLIKVYEANDKF